MQSSSSIRHWAIVSLIAGTLAVSGFFIPWFIVIDISLGGFYGSGAQFVVNTFVALLQGEVFLIIVLVALLLLLLLALVPLGAGLLRLAGKEESWLERMQVGGAIAGLVLMGLSVAFLDFLLASLFSRATIIPGVGVGLMAVGLVLALVAGIGTRRA